MNRPTFLAALTAISFLAAPLAAQDTGTPVEGDSETPPALDMGKPVEPNEPQLGQRYLQDTFEDWQLACIATEQENDPCSLLQVMTDQNGQPMAEVTLFRLANGPAVAAATVIVPLETLLPAQLTISIGDTLGKRYEYQYCTPIGCVAQVGLTAEDIELMKAEQTAVFSLVPAPAPDQRIDLTLSLKGFTAAYDVVDVVNN